MAPAFGQANLSNCELEQIHLAGSTQPNGALLVVREPGHLIVQHSANAADFLGLTGTLAGKTLADLPGDLATGILPHLPKTLDGLPVGIRCQVGHAGAVFDGLLHRPPGGGLVIELEQAGPVVDLSRDVQRGLKTIMAAQTLAQLCDEVAGIFRVITGYDRVMVYQFDTAGHGQVIAEERRPELEAFLGNRYPASDIPQMARLLYIRNRVRVLVDTLYTPVPLVPSLSPITGGQLDMSLCFLRSISPIHVQYLKNMGVGATLVASLVVGGRLWGLVSCHHYAPRCIHFETRSVCELLAETVATRIAALQSFAQGQAGVTVRRLEQRIVDSISRKGDWRSALFDDSRTILSPLQASGAALLLDGEILTVGDVPGTPELRALSAWLDNRPPLPMHVTDSLGLDVLAFRPLIPVASGIVAVRLSETPGEYLIWFRPERVRTLTWGGNPFKAVVIGNDPMDLSPRRSFAQWHQVVEGTCEPWSETDLTAARMIGDTVTDVILQFRAVRTLIAADQLAIVRQQVEQSDFTVIIADGEGRITLVNEAFKQLAPSHHDRLRHITDLAACCLNPASIASRLQDLVVNHRNWRGEIQLKGEDGARKPLMIRADAVFSPPTRLLGFVLLFTDLTEREAGDAARRRFQDGVLTSQPTMSGPIETQSDLVFQTLLATILENAQLAALEITDGVEIGRMPEMLESVRASVARASAVLEHLIRHATLAQTPK
jgi:chemotaxis family two-component system sensor kinase Cph1